MTYDVAVVGAGPAGAYAAYKLAQQGIRTLLLEKKELPRHKPCGGAVSQKAWEFLELDISALVLTKVYGATFAYKGQEIFNVKLPEPFCYLVRRDSFDYFLTRKAEEAGCELITNCQVLGIQERSSDVEITTSKGEFWARYLIAADGVNGPLGKYFDIQRKIGITVEGETKWVEDPLLDEILEGQRNIYIDSGLIKRGYAWIFPRGDRIATGVGTFAAKPKGLKSSFKEFNKMHGLECQEFAGYPIPLYAGDRKTYTLKRSLLAGDAAGLVDPLSGEGIYFALKSGAVAAEVLTGIITESIAELDFYNKKIEREVTPSLKKAAWLAKLFYGFPRQAHRILKNNPRLAQEFLKLVYGNGDYKAVYKALFYSIFRRAYR